MCETKLTVDSFNRNKDSFLEHFKRINLESDLIFDYKLAFMLQNRIIFPESSLTDNERPSTTHTQILLRLRLLGKQLYVSIMRIQ